MGEVSHSMRPSRGYCTEANTQRERRTRKFLEERDIRERVTSLGDFTQQPGRESLGQEPQKAAESWGLYNPRVYFTYG